MKILKKGTVFNHDVWVVRCSFCKTEVRILSGDPTVTPVANFDDYTANVDLRFRCPVCEAECDTQNDEVLDHSMKKISADDVKEIREYRHVFENDGKFVFANGPWKKVDDEIKAWLESDTNKW